MKTICCVCHKNITATGSEKQDGKGSKLSHGYCLKCYRKMMEEMLAYFHHHGSRASA